MFRILYAPTEHRLRLSAKPQAMFAGEWETVPLMPPSPARKFSFRPHEHLRRPMDFRRVYERRRSASDRWVIVYACENGMPHRRFGMSVSRKVGSAVVRNRLRRLYREAYRLTRDTLPLGLDIVVIPHGDGEPSLEELKRSLPRLIGQIARKLDRPSDQAPLS